MSYSLQALFECCVNLLQSLGLRLSGAAASLVAWQVGLLRLGLRLLLHCRVPHEWVTSAHTQTNTQTQDKLPFADCASQEFPKSHHTGPKAPPSILYLSNIYHRISAALQVSGHQLPIKARSYISRLFTPSWTRPWASYSMSSSHLSDALTSLTLLTPK